MRPLSKLLVASGFAGLLASSGAAAAIAVPGGPAGALALGQWTRVTSNDLVNSTDIGLARGRDGVLHVLWTTGSIGKVQVFDTPISASGKVGKTIVLASHLRAATDPDAAATSTGLNAFWNGQRTSSVTKDIGTWRETRPLRGGKWHLASITHAVSNLWFSPVSAAPGKAGLPWVTFSYSPGGVAVLHYGQREQGLAMSGCCDTNVGIGTDGRTGQAWLSYDSSVIGHVGVYDQQLAADGTRLGKANRMPGSVAGGMIFPAAQRVTATGRPGKSGVYATYLTPSARSVEVYRFGAAKALTAANVSAAAGLIGSTLAADPAARLWVAWWGGKVGSPTLFVSRSTTTVSGFSKAVQVRLPAGSSALYHVYISAQSSRLDILALLTVNFKIAYWTTQVPAPR